MELELIDYIFWGFITAVVLIGVTCLVIFLPREREYVEKHSGCYRIMYRDGSYTITHKKPVYGENTWSIRSKYFYIKNSPFGSEAFCDGAKCRNGKEYRANAAVTVYFPEDRLQIFAPNFHNVPHEAILETVEETLTAALTDAMSEYDDAAGEDAFKEHFKNTAGEKLKLFGLIVMSVNALKITETGSGS